jgi:hypothetical protein
MKTFYKYIRGYEIDKNGTRVWFYKKLKATTKRSLTQKYQSLISTLKTKSHPFAIKQTVTYSKKDGNLAVISYKGFPEGLGNNVFYWT